MKTFFLSTLLFLTASVHAAPSWSNKYEVPYIESQNDGYLTFSNGVEVRLRPTFYYLSGWDGIRDFDRFELFKRTFSSLDELFACNEGKEKWNFPLYHALDFETGQPCQLVMPEADAYAEWKTELWGYSSRFVYLMDPREQDIQLLCWQPVGYSDSDKYKSLPLNYGSTRNNAQPLRVVLYEHPYDISFFERDHCKSCYSEDLSHAHVVEADLLSFFDTIESIENSMLHLEESQIYVQDGASLGHIGDRVRLSYETNGYYQLYNCTQNISGLVVLSDPAFSNVDNFIQ